MRALAREDALPIAAALLGFGLLLAQACFPLPPQFRRAPMPASVLKQGEASGALHLGYNVQGVPQRHAFGEFTGAGFNTEGKEGSLYSRIGLPHGFEGHIGVGGPDLIPYLGLRYALLGRDWAHGPFVTLESGVNAVPDLYGGAALGAALGPIEPFVSARAGNYASLREHPYYEGAAGLAWRWKKGAFIAQYAGRQDGLDGHALAQGASVALELLTPSGPTPALEAQDASQRQEDADPCFADRPQNVYDPGQWEAYSACQEKTGNSEGAARSRDYAKHLREKPTIR